MNTQPIRVPSRSAVPLGRALIPGVRIAVLLTVAGLLVTNAPLCLAVVEPISPTADVSLSGISPSDAKYVYDKLGYVNGFSRDKDDCVGCYQGLRVITKWVYSSKSAYSATSWWVSGKFNSTLKLKPFRTTATFQPASIVYVEYSSANGGIDGTLRIRYLDGTIDQDLAYGISKTRTISSSWTSTRSGSFDFTISPFSFAISGAYSSTSTTTTEKVNVAGLSYRDRRSITIANSPLIVQMIHQWDSDTNIDAEVTAVDVTTGTVSQGTMTMKYPDGHIDATSIAGATLTTNTFLGHARALADQAWMSSAIFLSPTYPTYKAFQKGHVVFNLDVANTPIQYLISKNWDKLW